MLTSRVRGQNRKTGWRPQKGSNNSFSHWLQPRSAEYLEALSIHCTHMEAAKDTWADCPCSKKKKKVESIVSCDKDKTCISSENVMKGQREAK